MSLLANFTRQTDDELDASSEDILTMLDISIIISNRIFCEGLKLCLEKEQISWNISLLQLTNQELPKDTKSENIFILSNCSDGYRALKELLSSNSSSELPKIIVIYYTGNDDKLLKKYFPAKIMGIIEYDSDIQTYIEAITKVATGKRYYSTSIANSLLPPLKSEKKSYSSYKLTKREIEILKLISNGMSSKEIARHYELSVRTVETHRQSIRQKTQSSSLSELINIAKGMNLSI